MDQAGLREKETALTERIKTAGKLAVAFSGGVDSTYLLYKAHEVLGGDCIAVTVRSQVITDEEYEWTAAFCKQIGVKQEVIDFDVFSVENFADNPPDRCYHCKRRIFEAVSGAARENGIQAVADGSNVDDTGDYRPGMRALAELGIISPLKEAGLSKSDIRILSKEAGLATWDHPSAACLASRFAYGEKITPPGLERVAAAEKFIKDFGFEGIRVRVHGDIARIEADPADIPLLTYERARKEISAELRRLGFKYVTMDMDGYRTGSMNEVLDK
ncbi:MAG: ATP-dependent sacrificial sulfur transferase LarE [Lachnospiraceae bacterium]|nr:ATP-dependent sacrificial sulfur transferase LarE [Lachnospiraceae bacterium]